VGAVAVADIVRGESLQRSTSGRSELVSATLQVFENHPVAGVGVGSQPLASTREARPNFSVRRNTSHTTPLTMAAEQGLLGILAYAAFLAGAAAVLLAAWRGSRTLGLTLGGVMLALLVHSLFYSGFFQDPLTWGVPAVAAAAVLAGVREPVLRAARAEQPERVEVAMPAPSSGT
jgi:O-antigen ligase